MGILGKKSTNSRILEQFEHLPDILATPHGKNVDKTFLLYSNRPREGSVRLHATAVSRVLSTDHNKSAVFQQSRPHYNLSVVIHHKGPSLSKKAEILKEFLGILESFWRILDISKRILELFSGKFRDELRHI